MQRGASKANLLGSVPAVKSLDETRALISFLSSNVSLFRPAAMSTAALRRLVQVRARVRVTVRVRVRVTVTVTLPLTLKLTLTLTLTLILTLTLP